MDGIGQWIKKVRQEVELALSDSRPLPSAARLIADRVTLTLTLPAPQGSTGNQLTIEFQVAPADFPEAPAIVTGEAPAIVPEVIPVPCAPDAMRELVVEAAAAVFGPGGFDNSARAEVFCEMVSEMEQADVVTVLELIEGDPEKVPVSALQFPVARLRQLLRHSPLGTQSAARRLRETILQTSSASLVAILGEEWSFGTHWPVPSPSE